MPARHNGYGSIGMEVLEVCDAANNVSRLTRDFNNARKKFDDISSIINITQQLGNIFNILPTSIIKAQY